MFSFIFFRNKYIDIEIISFSNLNGAIQNKNLGISKFATAIKEWSRKNTFIISNGNNYYGEKNSNLLYGEPIDNLYKEINLTVSSVGINDLIWGEEKLKNSTTKYVSANIYYKDNNERVFEPYIIKKYKGIKIAFVGLISQDSYYNGNQYFMSNLIIKDPIMTAKKIIKELKNKTDLIILLTHLEIYTDENNNIKFKNEYLNKLFDIKEINLILNSYYSKLFYRLKNNIMIIQSESNGKNLIKTIFKIKKNGFVKNILKQEILIRNLYEEDLTEDENIKNSIIKYENELNNILNTEIINLDKNLFFTDIIKEIVNSNISIINKKYISNNTLNNGKVIFEDIYKIFSYDTNLIKFQIKGDLLKEILKNKSLLYSGLKYKNNILFLDNGEKVLSDKYYSISTNDYLLIDENLISKNVKNYDSYGNLRENIIEYLKSLKK